MLYRLRHLEKRLGLERSRLEARIESLGLVSISKEKVSFTSLLQINSVWTTVIAALWRSYQLCVFNFTFRSTWNQYCGRTTRCEYI